MCRGVARAAVLRSGGAPGVFLRSGGGVPGAAGIRPPARAGANGRRAGADRRPVRVRTGGTGARSGAVVIAAAAWALLFAAGSCYVALGGRRGSTMVAPAIVERVLADDPAMIRVLWVAGGLKVALAALLLGVVRLPARSRLRPWSGRAVQAVGVALALWGLAEGAVGLLAATGAIGPPDGWGDGSVGGFYAALWGPYWLLGGVLYVLAGGRVARPTGDGRSSLAVDEVADVGHRDGREQHRGEGVANGQLHRYDLLSPTVCTFQATPPAVARPGA